MSEVLLLNTEWKFTLTEEPDGSYKGLDDSGWADVTLPHDWSVSFPFDKAHSSGTGYLPGGIGWYRKRFTLPEDIAGKCVYIRFGGVYNNSRVWCNSNYLGKRPYGYSSFTYDISQFVVPGENVISVKVAHTDLADSRWFTGSGIYRDVTLLLANPIHFTQDGDGIFAYSGEVSESSAALTVEWKLSGEATTEFLLLDASGGVVAKAAGSGERGKAVLHVDKPALWSCDQPNLYTLKSRALVNGVVQDEETTSVGIRSIHFDCDTGFFLNGMNMKIKGVCLHHDAGALGAAVPKAVWRRRLEKLKEAGCNAIRTSHNPPDTHLLDLCDEMGFLVMDEAFDEWEGCKNKWWQGHNVYPPKRFGYADDYPQWHEADLTDMVKRDRNHPSVILWSIGNEVDYPNDPYGHPDFALVVGNNDANKPEQERIYDPNKPNAQRLAAIAQELSAIVKHSDTTRPVTSALAFPELSDIIGYTDALDVAGYNYKEQLYVADHAKHPARIIIGSENGHSAEQWAAVRDNAYISGQFLWTGIDYMGEAGGWPVRASGAGLLTMAGFEKPLYFLRKALWSHSAVAALFTSRNGDRGKEQPCWNYEPGEAVCVSCYTNCRSAELFLNGDSVGKQTAENGCRICWMVPFACGELSVICSNPGESEVTSTLRTAGKPVKIVLAPYATAETDILQIELALTDENGVIVTDSDRELRVTLSAGAQLLGLENGNIADVTPYPSAARKTRQGRLIAYLRKTNAAGHASLTVDSTDGLQASIDF